MSISSYFIRTVIIVSTINIRLGTFSSSSYFDYNGEHRDALCPSGAIPYRNHVTNHIKWCHNSDDCPSQYECTSIDREHFGIPIRYCCPSKISICLQSPSPGYGECNNNNNIAEPIHQTMYYFDALRLHCTAFQYVGCNGINENQFATLIECQNYCEATACQSGETLLRSSNQHPILCDDSTRQCPNSNYVCRYDSLFRRHVCCGYKSSIDGCPIGYRTYMNAMSGSAMTCVVNAIRDECPPDYLCTQNAETRQHYCCALEQGICALGQSPYIHHLTDKAIKCNPIQYISDCPVDFTCSASIAGAIWGFCCSIEIRAQCPNNAQPYINSLSNRPQKCTVGVTLCSAVGYRCMSRDANSLIGFCCSIDVETNIIDGQHQIGTDIHRRTAAINSIDALRTIGDVYRKHILQISSYMTTSSVPTNEIVDKSSSNTIEYKPDIRIVDIQKQIDGQLFDRQLENRQCIHLYHFPGTQLPLPCDPYNDQCPDSSECRRSPIGSSSRDEYNCCWHSDDNDDDERIITDNNVAIENIPSTFVTTLAQTNDPYCPTIIENRLCLPGSSRTCVEPNFFCQFNIDRHAFLCCSMMTVVD